MDDKVLLMKKDLVDVLFQRLMQRSQQSRLLHGLTGVIVNNRDCNPGLEFSIPGFGIVKFTIPGSRRDWRSIVKTEKNATWVTVFGSISELQVCMIVLWI